jgi:hypothetical protein
MQVKYKKAMLVSIIAGIFLSSGIANSSATRIEQPVQEPPSTVKVLTAPGRLDKDNAIGSIAFKHGDISWLPLLAKESGWPRKTWDKLGDIILRESGGCPNRIGGSIVDKNCNVVGHSGATNKSDSGLLQINGVNWDPKRDGVQLLCAEHKICTQEQLLDPVTNLTAGYILYQKAGWDPWDPCAWGPSFANRCKTGK